MNLHSLSVSTKAADRVELKSAAAAAAVVLDVVPRGATEETTQWTRNTLGLVINDKLGTFTTFICDFIFLFLLRFHHRI